MEFLFLFFLLTTFFLNISSQKSDDGSSLESDDDVTEVFNGVFIRYRAQIIHHIQSRLGPNNDDWEDVFQKTVIAIFQAIQRQQFDSSKGGMGSFIYGVTKNKIRDYFDEKKRLREDELPPELGKIEQLADDYSVEFSLVQEEAFQRLKSCLRELPEKYSSVLRLRYFEKLSMQEIARKLRRTPQQVVDLHRYGLRKLRDCFLRDEDK